MTNETKEANGEGPSENEPANPVDTGTNPAGASRLWLAGLLSPAC